MSLLHVPKLREFWAEMLEDGPRLRPDEAQTLLSGLGLNILEVNRFVLAERPPFEAFERWIIATNGGSLDEAELDRLRRALRGEMVGSACGDLSGVEGLSGEDLAHWDEHGYVIVRNAVPAQAAAAAADAVFAHLGARPDDPDSWYRNEQGHSIWVRTVRHPAFVANRRAPRVLKALPSFGGARTCGRWWTREGSIHLKSRVGPFPGRICTGTTRSPARTPWISRASCT